MTVVEDDDMYSDEEEYETSKSETVALNLDTLRVMTRFA